MPPIPSDLSIAVDRVSGLRPDFMKGADISMLAQIEASGGTFRQEDGAARDALEILHDHGVSWIRLRIWNNPVFRSGATTYHGISVTPGLEGGGNCDETAVRRMARRKGPGNEGLSRLPLQRFLGGSPHAGHPRRMGGHEGRPVEKAVFDYTQQVILDMKSDGAAPDMVEIGNEVNNGILWPLGRRSGAATDPAGYVELNRLLGQASKAVRSASPSSKIMIHIADDGGLGGVEAFFDNVDHAVDYDCIGLSYYPYWHGSLADLQTIMDTITTRYGKPVVIAEMAYPFTGRNGDTQANSWSGRDPASGGFDVSVQGQATAMRDIIEAVSRVPDGRGLGVFYWEPDWIPVPGAGWITGQGDVWDNQAWWDFNGTPLESMWTYRLASGS